MLGRSVDRGHNSSPSRTRVCTQLESATRPQLLPKIVAHVSAERYMTLASSFCSVTDKNETFFVQSRDSVFSFVMIKQMK